MHLPLLLTTPWRRAVVALRRRPGLLVTALAIGAIIGLVAAAPVLFVSSVGAGAVQQQYADTCPASITVTLRVPPYYIQPQGQPDSTIELQRSIGGDPTFAEAEHIEASYSPTPVMAGDREANIGFLVRDGWRDHVQMVSEEVSGDVFLPDTLAATLAVGPGDTILLEGTRELIVAGVFRDLTASPLDEFWCAATDAILPRNMYGEVFPPPMAIVERETYHDRSLRTSLYYSLYVAEFAHAPRTVEDADQLAAAAQRVRERAEDFAPQSSVTFSIDRLDQRARLVRSAVADTTMPVAVLAAVCALSLSAVLGLLWVRARRNTCIALATIGVSPIAIGVKAVLETGLALMVGAAGGVAVARQSMGVWAPAHEVEPGAIGWAAAVGGLAVVVAALVVAGTAAVSCRALLRHAAPARRRWWRFVPWELGLGAVAWAAAASVGTEALVPVDGKRVVDTSSAVLVLPLAVLALGAALAARGWALVVRRRGAGGPPRRLERRLALRRLQLGAGAGTAILGAGTLALGVSVFGLAMNSSLERTGVAKSAVYVGSDIRVLIAGSMPAGGQGATEVWQRSEMEFAGEPVDVLAVDPASFEQAAFWDDAFADGSLGSLLAALQSADGETVPAILVGEAASAGDVVNPKHPGEPWPVRVVAHADAFPGAGSKRPTLVVPLAAAKEGPINFFHFVFAKGRYGDWRAPLQEMGAQPMLSISRQDAVDSSVLQFAAWSFDFVKALGVFVGVLVVAALLLHLAVRQRQQALGFAFLRRMGFTHRRHWWALAVEVGSMMAGVLVLGTGLALACVRIVAPHVDPLPTLPPHPLMVVPWLALAVVGLVGVAVVLLGSAAAQVIGARVDVAEVLRDGT